MWFGPMIRSIHFLKQTQLVNRTLNNHLHLIPEVFPPSCVRMAHVFVYGTLKKGQPNYFRMFHSPNGKAEFLASACTTEKYPLVIASEYNIPFLLNIPGQGHRVQGEIYKVDDQMLKFLDAFEGIPTMYQRTLVKLEVKEWKGQTEGEETPSPGSITEAFVYSTTTYKPDWPSLPSYESYDSYGDHGLKYVTREARD
ncbi:gamma-glutamylaminecyclotransferase-like [Thunnus albacares]|uniref:gamma-glutamylaminecyclotransferase-like n=1 Tax=Thunnus albacares TaxID=8236 RepID=UPI001CF64185|nr:gamma-glutamylaminecyclotransferase-like [Thunnus albacares]